eukprot:845188-Pelagomonas_calceolata.AAC.1
MLFPGAACSRQHTRAPNALFSLHGACSKKERKKRLRSPGLAACIQEGSPVLKRRAPPQTMRKSKHRSHSSKLAPTMGSTTRLSGRPCPASSRPTLKP